VNIELEDPKQFKTMFNNNFIFCLHCFGIYVRVALKLRRINLRENKSVGLRAKKLKHSHYFAVEEEPAIDDYKVLCLSAYFIVSQKKNF
jgi:hypothetical protein